MVVNCPIENVLTEYHILAYYYKWSYAEIKTLPRTAREVFCFKVKQQIDAENGKNNDLPKISDDTSNFKSGGKPYKESL